MKFIISWRKSKFFTRPCIYLKMTSEKPLLLEVVLKICICIAKPAKSEKTRETISLFVYRLNCFVLQNWSGCFYIAGE